MVYTVTLNPALDYVMKVESLRFDDINRANGEAIYYGGKGINVSVVLSRLAVHNTALGFIAGFTGNALEGMLKADGINCDFVRLDCGNTRINVKIKAETELDINADGPAISESDVEKLLGKLDGIERGDYLVLAGSVPKTLPGNIYEKILERLDGRGINFVVDATGDLLLNSLKYRPFLIKPNHLELAELFKKERLSEDEIVYYAKELQSLGAKNVLVSRADDGAILVDENGNVSKSKNAEGTLVNSVGCGDSMLAGFLAGCINGDGYESALRLGTACGNATAYSEGLAEKAEIERLYALL